MNAKTGFILLLIVLLSLASFLAGYFFIDIRSNNRGLISDSILARFVSMDKETVIPIPSLVLNAPLSAGRVNSVTLGEDLGSVMYYEKTSGHIIKLDVATGIEYEVTKNSLPNFISSIWALNKKDVISLFYSPSGNYYKYYNFKTQRTHQFPNTIKSIVFSPDGKKIAYFDGGTLDNSIYISHIEDFSSKLIIKTRLTNVKLFWPTDNFIYAQSFDDATGVSSVFRLTEDGNMSGILDGQAEMRLNFSPSGKNMLYSYLTPTQLVSGLYLGGDRSLEITWPLAANECAWSTDEDTVYCASFTIKDSAIPNIVSYNISKNSLAVLGPMPFDSRATTVLLSQLEDYLVLVNSVDEKVYSFKIR